MLTLGQLVKSIHDLRVKVHTAKWNAEQAVHAEGSLAILFKALDEVEKELERMED